MLNFVLAVTIVPTPNGLGISEVLGSPELDWLNIIDSDEDSLNPFPANHECPYLETSKFCELLTSNKFSLVSMNVRSLGSKFNDLTSFVMTIT